jgi:hypothetical protein
MEHAAATQIQKVWNGYIYRKTHIPNSLQSIGRFLNSIKIKCASDNSDGRINSCFDEDTCVKLLRKKYGNRIKIPKKRHWYDILVRDYQRGWLPCNIKSTLTTQNDNTGNLAMCVYAYTNYKMDILKQYNNGKMALILHTKIKNKQYNISLRDYYFIVINKSTNAVIINCCKGLTKLTPNVNNLPFQVCWSKNLHYIYKHINDVVNNFVKTIQQPSPSWKETFLVSMRTLNINE